ncbi:MAG: coniferyl aldehyde dehydrogenase [Parvibaculaceae bacterium]
MHQLAYSRHRSPTLRERRNRLDSLIRSVVASEDKIVDALIRDFGRRSRMETLFGEVVSSLGALRHARRNIGRWEKKQSVSTPIHMLPGRSYIVPQPLGVVGIVSPWNYPFFLAISPLAPAIAAGNRVMIKPSELTPYSSDLLSELVTSAFPDGEVTVHLGGSDVGAQFAELPFDHLLFTGSTFVGRKIALSAAQNLTPVTLELGGKSPAIIDPSAEMKKAVESIIFGKCFNSGQTCVAPDYVLVSKSQLDQFLLETHSAYEAMYPDCSWSDDSSAIVSARHFERLLDLVKDAEENGVETHVLFPERLNEKSRSMPLILLVDPDRNLRIMQEEIFGPLLPIITYSSIDEALDYVNAGQRPLALYWFGRDRANQARVLTETTAGGVTLNDTNWHVVQENLPFGGVGASGHGVYHGRSGFETFSHMKPVFEQSRFSQTRCLYPPFTKTSERMLRAVMRIL